MRCLVIIALIVLNSCTSKLPDATTNPVAIENKEQEYQSGPYINYDLGFSLDVPGQYTTDNENKNIYSPEPYSVSINISDKSYINVSRKIGGDLVVYVYENPNLIQPIVGDTLEGYQYNINNQMGFYFWKRFDGMLYKIQYQADSLDYKQNFNDLSEILTTLELNI